MDTIKDIINFCNAAVFYDYTNGGITGELNQVRECVINSSYKTIPDSRIRGSLSIIDEIIFKTHDNDVENIIENIHDLGENLLYMISFEKLIGDEQQKVIEQILNDDE